MLLTRLKSFSGWGQSLVVELMKRYKLCDIDEMFEIMVSKSESINYYLSIVLITFEVL